MKKAISFIILALLITVGLCQDDQSKAQEIFLSAQKTCKLTGPSPLVGVYELVVLEKDIPKNQDKWYLFAMAERKQDAQLLGTPSKIEIRKIDKNGSAEFIRECAMVQQTDACFIKNNDFNYKTQKIQYKVYCEKECEFGFVTEIDYSYPLQMNKPFKLNFENTAYSKIFTLNTEGNDFYELRILLLPRGFIKYGEPIVLFANYGSQVPTREKHDFQGIHTWDDGQGIFIRKSQMRNRTLTILVEGPQKNVLILHAKGWQKQQKIRLMQYWPQFDVLRTGQSRDFEAEVSKNVTHRVKIVTFSGAVQTTKIYKLDGQTQISLNFANPIMKYGEIQYRLSKDLLEKEKVKKFLIRVTVKKQTTYLVTFGKEEEEISLLFPYISQTSYMEPKQIDQYYFKIEELIETAREKKSSKIEVIFGNIQGNISPKFYKCNAAKKAGVDNLKQCQYSASNRQDFIEVTSDKFENRGGEKRYWFDIQWLNYIKKSQRDKVQVVFQMVVVVENTNEGKPSSYEIQYKNKDRIYLLKEGETTKDRVFIDEKRHYKLSIQDSDASEVRIHCTKISGEVIFFGSMQDPRQKKDHEKILPIYGIVTYKLNANKKVNQVFLQVEGIDNALYSITTQIIRKSEANPSKKNGTGYNQLIVKQEIPYEFVIGPQDSIVIQLRLAQKQFVLHLKASSAIQICMTQNLVNPPYPPNCQIRNDSVLQIDDKLYLEKGLVGNIGLKNSNNDKNATVKVTVSKTKNQSEPQCQLAPMNEIMWKRVGSFSRNQTKSPVDDHEENHCIEFDIARHDEIQLIVDIRGNTRYSDGKITASINDQEIIKIMSPSHIFTKEEVQSACKAKSGNKDANFCYLKVTLQRIKNTRMRVLAQYTDSALRLVDGVSHSVHSVMKKTQPKYFYMGIHNFENITVFLENKVGEYKIYASLMKYEEFNEQKAKKNNAIFPTKQNKDLESSNPFYYLQQIITIPEQKIKQKCPEFSFRVTCILLLSVVLDSSNQILKNGKFVIEATQQNRELKEGVPLNGYLQKKSVMFYHYENTMINGTMIVNVNNQNKNCLDIYVREGSQRASASNNLKHTKATNTLIVPKLIPGTYSVTLEANENCQYSVEITTTKNNLNRLKKDAFKDVNIEKDQSIYLLYENQINQTFKVLSSQKSGQVMISVNPVPRDQLEDILTGDMNAIKSWTWTNKDSVRINNVGRNGRPNANYCIDCYYLIKVTAQRPTQASIIIPTPDIELPITTDSLIKDILLKGQVATFRVFTQSSSQFETYVQYGKIRITIFETEKNTSAYNKTFEPTKAPVIESFNLSKSESYEYLRYSKVKIQALQQSYFSFAIISNPDPNRRGSGLKYGIPQYIYLQAGKQKCIFGSLVIGQDQFLLSFSRNDKTNIQALEIKIKADSKDITYNKQMGNNQMLIKTNYVMSSSAMSYAFFDFCMRSKQPMSVTVIQTSSVNYWPEKESIVVKKELNMTFGSQGKNIIEINQCRSRAVTEIFSEFNHIKSTQSEIKQRRRNNNIVEFYHYGAVYVHLKTEKATMRWFYINETSGAGQGYDDYQASIMRVFKNGNQIQATAEPLKQSNEKEVKSKIQNITYSFYAAREQMELYGAMNCMEGEFVKKTVSIDFFNKPGDRSSAKVSFDIQNDLKPKFSKQSYFLIGLKAEAFIKTAQGQMENYRFYYPYQQVSKEMLTGEYIKPTNPQSQDQEGSSFLIWIGYLLLGLVIIVLSYCIYAKYLRHCFSKKQRLNQQMDYQMKYSGFANHH